MAGAPSADAYLRKNGERENTIDEQRCRRRAHENRKKRVR